MRYKAYHPDYEEIVRNAKVYFTQTQQILYTGRNTLKKLFLCDKVLVIKSFKIPNCINKIAYTYFRDSKAKKSYLNAIHLGDFTPKPIGYVEYFNSFLFSHSFYICENYIYDFTIREPLLDSSYPHRKEIFKSFAYFTARLHDANVMHLDYSPGNILVHKIDKGYVFKLVDINRMKFKQLSKEERLKSFSKLWANDEDLALIVKYYAPLVDMDYEDALKIVCKASDWHKKKKNLKKRIREGNIIK